ncbi:HIRAN domain-containing protein [Metasolibacillus sp. FSL K6-0083]|uniref:HIRAN domain-containing protein n=1 Tax=Metasolibacillus sp. FSL K6-0083 TaxID=2921416 RepID=UPI00315A0BDC
MRKQPFELWLIWQNVETRQRYHVGRLFYEDGLYTFIYETKGVRRKLKEAMENGYRPHLAFPNTSKIYTSSTLFGPFARRLPDVRRPDYLILLQELGLSVECTDMDVLRATGGILATDAYEFVSPIYFEEHAFAFDFFIAGWRYYDGERLVHELQVGDGIDFLLDPDNPHDNKAVIITSLAGDKLGFVPAFYSGWMFEVIEKGCHFKAKVEAIHPHAAPHRKVSISVVGTVNQFVDTTQVLNGSAEWQLIMC